MALGLREVCMITMYGLPVRVCPDWRAQCLRRLAGPVFSPLGGANVCAARRGQYFRGLAGSVFSPLGGPSIFAAWRAQYLRRLAAQYFRRLASPVFTPLGGYSHAVKTLPAGKGFVFWQPGGCLCCAVFCCFFGFFRQRVEDGRRGEGGELRCFALVFFDVDHGGLSGVALCQF